LHGRGVPENSLEAARRAIAAGMGIECDIQRSRDDHTVVFHDWDLDRLTAGEGPTQSHTSAQLQQLRYHGSDERIATLHQFLETVGGVVPLLIEIKSKPGCDVERICAAVSEALEEYAGHHAVMSFDPRAARWFRRNAPHIVRGLVVREDEYGNTQTAWQRRVAFWIAKPDFLAYDISSLPNHWVTELRDEGLPILTWTVNSRDTRKRALASADALISEGEGLDRERGA
jgi:glycerophosphoryl diester phosphodiesterase